MKSHKKVFNKKSNIKAVYTCIDGCLHKKKEQHPMFPYPRDPITFWEWYLSKEVIIHPLLIIWRLVIGSLGKVTPRKFTFSPPKKGPFFERKSHLSTKPEACFMAAFWVWDFRCRFCSSPSWHSKAPLRGDGSKGGFPTWRIIPVR